MTYKELESACIAYAGKPAPFWIESDTKLILKFVNMARKKAVRERPFEAFRTLAGAQIPATGPISFDSFVSEPEGSTTVKCRTLYGVYQYSKDATSGLVTYLEPYEFRNWQEIERNMEGRFNRTNVFFVKGRTLDAYNISSRPLWVGVDICKLPDDIAETATSDYFLDYGEDWLLWTVLGYMNKKLKEDERVIINKADVNDAWKALIAFDEGSGDRYSEWTNLNFD